MDLNVLYRLLACICISLAFFGCFVPVTARSQTISETERFGRSKRQAAFIELTPRQSYRNRTSDKFVPNFVQGPESGPWGPWTESSQCSRTCGGGVANQDRICMDTRPDGSHSCHGAHRRYFSCNVQDCPRGAKDFRALQCERFNTVEHNGIYYSYEPYYHTSSPCELFCSASGGNFVKKFDTKVIDGTKCRDDGSLDVCVDGQCMPVGCDNVLGSTKKEDQCRVCGGDGSTCSLVHGVFDDDAYEVGYNDILLIPVGATSILIQKPQPSKNFLAVRNYEGKYYLNGGYKIEYPKDLLFAGTVFHYGKKSQGPLASETLSAQGPTTEAVFIVLLYQEKNLGITYDYAIPVPAKTPSPNSYIWTTGDFEECSQTCGGGVQYRPVRCIRESDRDIADERLCDPVSKPNVEENCNNQPCPSLWKIGEWSECSQECGGGTQFRVVYCHQQKDGNTVLIPDESCDGDKPLFMRSCNVDKECPDWVTGEWSECDSLCGTGNQNRSLECHSKETGEAIDESFCDSKTRPDDKQSCTLGPCEGVEWIVSDWSGCEGSCSPRMESREVHCANEEGTVFPNDACEPSKMPDLTRPCPKSDICEPMWHTSEWTECSVKCGNGVQSRVVFCGAWQEDSVIKIEEKKCDPDKKFEDMQNCSADSCQGIWFTGPWNRCSVPCGGGERTRKILCFHDDEVVDSSQCNPSEEPFDKEPCNMTPCDDDEIMSVGGCKNTKYGCCPDGMTPAGLNYEGCTNLNISSTNVSCEEADFGCCADGFTLALGPFKKGCPSSMNCSDSKYGCCADEKTAAKGPNLEGCPETSNCTNSTFGCCFDGLTAATGPSLEGCPEEENCTNSTYGCCADGITAASGPALEGCPEESNCTNSTFGCCLDGFTAAAGPSLEGCPEEEDCTNSTYGCCSDGVTSATGPGAEGCPKKGGSGLDVVPGEFESSGEDCYDQMFGCCPDRFTPASGPNQEGCEEVDNGTDCKTSAFGCCEDGFTPAIGPSKEGCADIESSGDGDLMVPCEDSVFGCCSDNITAAKGFNGEGCEDCSNSTFGCCPDNVTVASGPNGTGCFPEDCSNSTFGCCPDNITVAIGPNEEGCEPVNCTVSEFGCCPDNVTTALGPEGEGCIPEECSNSTFGCCSDNLTLALGPDGEGCFDNCSLSSFGCCDDNVTSASGPNGEGCSLEDCSNTTYGCCPDNVTIALGSDGEGCGPEDCSNTTYGCCPDNVTIALGPEGEGCGPEDCTNTTYGCCPDNVTIALGPEGEGCGPEDCTNTTYGCCSDNVTVALGPEGEGCGPEDCTNTTYGCCPDNVTIALGPEGEGCGPEDCTNTTYGCCPDNVTVALGPDDEGCIFEWIDCNNGTFGCCPDGFTFASGPENEGCNKTVNCTESFYGCCPNNESMALGPNYEGCENITDCVMSEFGCCPDNVTVALGSNFEGCEVTDVPQTTTEAPAECLNTLYGCCPDEITTALGSNLEGCCFGLRFGCCPDNKTAALGPNYLGCGCQTFPFGCCPDNITPAQGPSYHGCRCEHTHYGCCQDNLTPAKGPQFQGCECQFMHYGCCPDGFTPIISERGEGCGCDSTRYGCCPDGRTAATSADLSGCPCNTLPYGCCPDGHTPARTSDLRDCPCESHSFGCCLDGRTIARGPNYEGCPCDFTRFGCCQDGKTTAQGPGFEGCPCETKTYGCCADGYTPAEGPNYEGCPDVLVPKPKVSTEVCSLPKEPGPCRNYTIKWFFDLTYGGCTRFWYGGCDGNGNVFATQEDCESACVRPEGPEACLLPMVTGSCESKVLSWYFDAGSKTCETFTYGGCLGNNNRFATKTDCVEKCINNQPPPKPVDKCSLPKDEGGCDSAIIKWHYNGKNEKCEAFYYGGCKGNANRFESRLECEKSCLPISNVTDTVCRLPHEIGPCNEFRERWYFDYENGQCHRFIYGGCKGNDNNFGSYSECEKRCGRDVSSEPPPDLEFKSEFCFQLQDSGPCTNNEVNWYYDSRDGVCKEFYYGGCKGNGNRFKTRKECEKSCVKAQDLCGLPAVKGPCSGTFDQWYYDKSQDECYEFSFSGCQGNANRFNDRESCHLRCKKEPTTTEPSVTTSDVCSLPKEPGPCLGYYRAWYYDNSENACKSFIYGGCDGNENRFDRRRECEQRCVKKKKASKEPKLPKPERPSKPDNEDVCRLPVEPGPCTGEQPRWFYDAQTQSCLPFVYGGCDGNKNRFKTAEICLRFCSGIKAKPGSDEVPYITVPTTTTTTTTTTTIAPTTCPQSNCAEIKCPFGIEETFDSSGCSSCRCSNPCEVHTCPEGSRCAIDVMRTSNEGVRTEPVCRRVQKPGVCPSSTLSSGPRDCELRCRDDADCRGEHKCCNNGCAFNCMPPADESFVAATQPEPATILPGVNVTKGVIGEPAELPCNARGWPKPTVTWWRETTMLPLSSSRYEQQPDYALLIKTVVFEDRGDYSCHAHNGIGLGATYKVTLIIDFQPEAPSRGDESDVNSRDSEPESPSYPVNSFDDVPVAASVSLITSRPMAGSPLQVDCTTEGPPDTKVTWQFGETQLIVDDRRRILSNHTLFITKTDISDTGEYRCTAQYHNNVATSSVYVEVEAMPTESACVDNPQFKNCNLIVKANYCNNKYYGKYCCASCMRAGQLHDMPHV